MYKKLSIALLLSIVAINHSSAVSNPLKWFGKGKSGNVSVQLSDNGSSSNTVEKSKTILPTTTTIYGSPCDHNALVAAANLVKEVGDSALITKNFQRSWRHPRSNGNKTGYVVTMAQTDNKRKITKTDESGSSKKYPKDFVIKDKANRPVTPLTITGLEKNLVDKLNTHYDGRLKPKSNDNDNQKLVVEKQDNSSTDTTLLVQVQLTNEDLDELANEVKQLTTDDTTQVLTTDNTLIKRTPNKNDKSTNE